MADFSAILGPTSLFIGIESESWALTAFQGAAQIAKALGVSTLLVKIADGTNVWYSGIGGWKTALDAVEAQGVKAVPYTYCYGNKFGAIDVEIDILKAALATTGIVIADMEAEWNGQTSWGSIVASALAGHTGKFGVVTWADPDQQNWQGVIANLKPCVDFWMPQAYSDFLASTYPSQFAGLPVVPVLNLGTDAGSNDILGNAKAVQATGGHAIALWEYQALQSYRLTVEAITSLFPVNEGDTDMPQLLSITDPFAARHFTATDETHWKCKDNGVVIQDAILEKWRQTQGCARLPLTPEIYGVISGGSFQVFEAGVWVWDPQHSLDNPGQGDTYMMHLDKDTPGLRRLMALAGIAVPSVTQAEIDTAATAIKGAQANLAVAASSLVPAPKIP